MLCVGLNGGGRGSRGGCRGGEGRVLTRLFTKVDLCNTFPGSKAKVVFALGY